MLQAPDHRRRGRAGVRYTEAEMCAQTIRRAPSSATAPPPLEELVRRLEGVVERSPADETEVVWIDTLAGLATGSQRRGSRHREDPRRRCTVLVRVRERGRVGFYRTGDASPGELDNAVRQALGQAAVGPEGPPLPLAGTGGPPAPQLDLHDSTVAELDVATAGELLEAGMEEGDSLVLEWHELRLVTANSRGLARSAAATSVTLRARSGRGPGAGRAAGSARSLGALAAPRIVERARRRAADGGEPAALPEEPVLVLSPEATTALICLLADTALTASSFHEGSSFLAGRLGQQVFDPGLDLVDDGTDPAGLPFPFDLDGWTKRRVVLVEGGVVRSPALDPELSSRLDLTATPHAVGFHEARPDHLLVGGGELEVGDASAPVDGPADGLWIGELERPRCTDPRKGRFRARARGVRRVEGGTLGAPVADLAWEGRLERVLARLQGLGRERVVVARNGALGSCCAPAAVLAPTGGLSPLG